MSRQISDGDRPPPHAPTVHARERTQCPPKSIDHCENRAGWMLSAANWLGRQTHRQRVPSPVPQPHTPMHAAPTSFTGCPNVCVLGVAAEQEVEDILHFAATSILAVPRGTPDPASKQSRRQAPATAECRPTQPWGGYMYNELSRPLCAKLIIGAAGSLACCHLEP